MAHLVVDPARRGSGEGRALVRGRAQIAARRGRGVPPFVIEQILAIFAHLRAGGQASTTPAVTNLLGQPARTLRDFVNAHASAFTTLPEHTSRVGILTGAERQRECGGFGRDVQKPTAPPDSRAL